ncbi:hypothetical protein J4475_03655 [Candidatus Woesearchaeota archaeon]|nr:hypothetical protein [Candidatus Woesearchaeota archaeon]
MMAVTSYKCKSAIIGRMHKRSKKTTERLDTLLAFVNLCDKSNPIRNNVMPFKFLEFEVQDVKIKGLDVDFMIDGSDIVLDNLSSLSLEVEDDVLVISGEQA